MPIAYPADLDLLRAVALSKNEKHDAYNLASLCIALYDQLSALHDWTIDQGAHVCSGIPGGCPVLTTLDKVNDREIGPTNPQTGKERMPGP